jgi:hypothetical protein
MPADPMSDIVDRLRRGPINHLACDEAAAEIERQRAEIASLRLTLGGRTFSADVPEPIGCPVPGACVQVAEIERLRAALRAIRDCEPERHAWSIGVARAALGEDGRDPS